MQHCSTSHRRAVLSGITRRRIVRRPGLPVAVALLLTATVVPVTRQLGKEPTTIRTPPPSSHPAAGVTFTEITRQAGLESFRRVSGIPAKDYIQETMGGGCAFFDYDNDGWLDIYLVNGGTTDALLGKAAMPRAALFHNNHDGTFTDVTQRAGVANERWGQGVCAGDLDNDGWEDLYVTNFGKNRLYRNNHDGTFTDIAEQAGVALGGWSTGSAFGDYDRDGRLDLFVAGYVDLDLRNPPPAATGPQLSKSGPESGQSTAATGLPASYSPSASYCQYRGVRVNCGPRGLKGLPDHLFHNRGDGTFEEVSARAGVSDKIGFYGIGVAWFDFDDDGWLDLFVANDSQPNYLYRNRRDGTFEDVSFLSGTAFSENGTEQACMGVAVGDYDGDGRDDLHITNFADDSNTLYRNNGNGSFDDMTFAAGLGEITLPFVGWGTNFFDFDNDGHLDLLVANGHVYPQADAAEWNTTYKQRLLLFRNVAARFFEVGSSSGEALVKPRCSRGTAIGDFDNDGDLDVLINNLEDTPTLLRNDGANRAGHWLLLRLVGDPSQKTPKDAIGSVVFCTAGGRRLRGEVASGRSYISQSDLKVHFGLGAADRIEKLEVRWAGGSVSEYTIPGLDRQVVIDQAKGVR